MMSTRFEWFDATYVGVWHLPPVHDVSTGLPADDDTSDETSTDDRHVLIISGDETTVLAGTVEELHALVDRMRAALPPLS
jgi:hypothetical protein